MLASKFQDEVKVLLTREKKTLYVKMIIESGKMPNCGCC